MFFILLLCFAIAVQMILFSCLLLLGTKAENTEGRGLTASCVFLSVWETELLKEVLDALGCSL